MWTDNLTAQPSNFSTIQSLLTQQNGIIFDSICSLIEEWCQSQGITIEEMGTQKTFVNCGEVPNISADSISSLKSLGLIESTDDAHIAVSTLGWQFIQAMRG